MSLPAGVSDLWLLRMNPLPATRIADPELATRVDSRRFAAALARERAMLRRLVTDPDFQRSLALVAPRVRYAAARYGRGDRRDRKSERGLWQYATRAMFRTTPLTRFTAVGFVTIDPGGEPLDRAGGLPAATPFVELDRAALGHLLGGVLPYDPVDPYLATALPGGGGLPAAYQAVLRQVQLGPRRLSTVCHGVAEALAVPPDTAAAIVQLAREHGLLVAGAPPPDLAEVPLAGLAARLAGAGCAPRAVGLVADLAATVDRFGAASGPDRPALRCRLADRTRELAGLARRPVSLAVYEDYLLRPRTAWPGSHLPALRDLAGVLEFLSAFDRRHAVRALLSAAFADRFGAGARVPLVTHAEALVRAVYRAEVGGGGPALEKLQAVRRRALDALVGRLDGRTGAERGDTSPGWLASLVADLPEWCRRAPADYAVLVQPAGDGLVVNDVYGGAGTLLSRYLLADAALGGQARERLRRRLRRSGHAATVRVLEDAAPYGYHGNVHPPLLDPITADEWFTLDLCHDPVTGELTLVDRAGTPVQVPATGAGWPELLPFPARVAAWLAGSGRPRLDLLAEWRRRLGPATAARTLHCPRVSAGRVVLHRARWYPGEDFPSSGGLDAAGRLAALSRWRARHRVPAQVFLKTDLAAEEPAAWALAGDQAGLLARRRREKPQYLDLGSALCTTVLPRLLARRGPGYLEEALPAVAGEGHAVEWVIEWHRPAGGRFGEPA